MSDLKAAQGKRRQENNRIYAHPLPILFTKPASLFSVGLQNPQCTGHFDVASNSVWITESSHIRTLWTRGFFGKGTLSRSEPSWHTRTINARKDKKQGRLTSEEVTALRRAERKQFKLDRRKAIEATALEAEALFKESEGKVVIAPALSGPAIPSAATWKPSEGEIAFIGRRGGRPQPENTEDTQADEEEDDEEEHLEDVEHLQLTLQEAWFLSWALGCLTILHNNVPITSHHFWSTITSSKRFDNPFLVQYVAYHHFRSLGWVVKGGIKFCVDYLLYKRGPVFSHAEFAVVVVPVYEDPEDAKDSPHTLQNVEPFTWSWLSTLNRVNTQVQKVSICLLMHNHSDSGIDACSCLRHDPISLAHPCQLPRKPSLP